MRYALDILSVLTVIPKTQLLLAENVAVLDEGGSTISTVGKGLSEFQVGIENYKFDSGAVIAPICVCHIGCNCLPIYLRHEHRPGGS